MANVTREISLAADSADVWDAVRDWGALHERLVPGFVTDTQVDGGSRIVTFASGAVARELIVDVDDETRRLAYSIVESPLGLEHHHATVEVFAEGEGCRFVWTADLLPDDRAEMVGMLTDQGIAAVGKAFAGPA